MHTEENTSELRSRDWILTIPADGDKGMSREEVESALASYSAYVGQLEQGKSGYLHWQVYLSHSDAIRFKTLKKKLPTAHLEKRRGTVRQAVDYCTKEDTRVPDSEPLVKGTIEFRDAQGQRSDLIQLREEILETNIKLSSLLASNPNAWKYERQCRALIEARNTEKWGTKNRDVQVKVIFGETGTGKTFSVLASNPASEIYRTTHYGTGAFDGYDAHDVLVLDEYRGQIPVGQLLAMLDPYPCKLPARYTDKQAAFTSVYLVSNDPPWLWYPQESDATKLALFRRFDEVIEYRDYDEPTPLDLENVRQKMLESKLAS